MHLLQYAYSLSDYLTPILEINIPFRELFVLSSSLSNCLLGLSKEFIKPCFLVCQSEIRVVVSKSLWVALVLFSLSYSLNMYFHASVFFGCRYLLVCQHQMLFVSHPELICTTYKVQSFILQTKCIAMLMYNLMFSIHQSLHILPRLLHPDPYPFCVDEFQVDVFSFFNLDLLFSL